MLRPDRLRSIRSAAGEARLHNGRSPGRQVDHDELRAAPAPTDRSRPTTRREKSRALTSLRTSGSCDRDRRRCAPRRPHHRGRARSSQFPVAPARRLELAPSNVGAELLSLELDLASELLTSRCASSNVAPIPATAQHASAGGDQRTIDSAVCPGVKDEDVAVAAGRRPITAPILGGSGYPGAARIRRDGGARGATRAVA